MIAPLAHVFVGDCRKVLATLPQGSVHLAFSSPPYYRQRRYADAPADGGIGWEPLFDCEHAGHASACGVCYLCMLTSIYQATLTILHPTGSCWIVIGDSYDPDGSLRMAPARLALSLQRGGARLRMLIPWIKPVSLPESVRDRCPVTHEWLIVLTPGRGTWFDRDACREPPSAGTLRRIGQPSFWQQSGGPKDAGARAARSARRTVEAVARNPGRYRRTSDWTRDGIDAAIGETRAYLSHLEGVRANGGMLLASCGEPLAVLANPEASTLLHTATFPAALVRPCVRLACPPRVCTACHAPAGPGGQPGCVCGAGMWPGQVLDLFAGIGTAGAVAREEGRRFLGIELSPTYATIAAMRLDVPLSEAVAV